LCCWGDWRIVVSTISGRRIALWGRIYNFGLSGNLQNLFCPRKLDIGEALGLQSVGLIQFFSHPEEKTTLSLGAPLISLKAATGHMFGKSVLERGLEI
jgi:hypothetical protein